MCGYIKYFENGGKNISFTIEDQDVYLKYNEIWNKTKNVLNIKFHNEPIYDDKYIKTKVKTFNSMINTLFTRDEIPKERIHYVCIPAICIDSNCMFLSKWLSVRLRIKWLWVRIPLQSLKLRISRLFRARSSLTFRQL